MNDREIKHVLIVDDEKAYVKLIKRYLRKRGYDCVSASDGERALKKLSQQPFELMISDIVMRGMDGLQLVREALKRAPHLACILMTGHPAAYSFSDIIACGATDFILKPIEFTELQAKMERIARERRIQLQLREANGALAREVALNVSINELSKTLMTSLSIREIFMRTVQESMNLTGSGIAAMIFTEQDSDESVVLSSSNKTAAVSGEPCSADCQVLEKLCGALQDHPVPVVANSTDEVSAILPALNDLPQLLRLLSVPVVVNGTLRGQIVVADAPGDYTGKELSAVKRLTTVLALGLERRQANTELKRTKEHLEFVFDNASEAVGIVDAQGLTRKWNKAAVELFGYRAGELQGKSIYQLYASSEQLERMLVLLRQQGFVKRYEVDIRKKDGQTIPVELSIALLKDSQGKVLGSVTVALDLSDIKEALARIRQINVDLEAEVERRKTIEKELIAARTELEKLVEERTAKLSQAGALLRRSINVFKDVGGM